MLRDDQAKYFTDYCGIHNLKNLGEVENWDNIYHHFKKPEPKVVTTGRGAHATTTEVAQHVSLNPLQAQKLELLWKLCHHYVTVNQEITEDSVSTARA